MTFWRLLLVVVVLQPSIVPPAQLIRLARPLQRAEISAVLDASRAAVAEKTFTLSSANGGNGLEIFMRADGWPRLVRSEGGISGAWSDYVIDVVEYTGRRARRCEGSTVPGELVITYEHSQTTDMWTAVAGTRGEGPRGFPPAGVPVANPVFDVLAGRIEAASDAATTAIDGRAARGFTASFSPPPTMYVRDTQNQVRQTLWIDVDSLLPVRWDVTEGATVAASLVLTYTPLDLRPPAGVEAPRCIP